MKLFIMLVASLSLLSCKKKLPAYPSDLKDFHQFIIRGQSIQKETLTYVLNEEDLSRTLRSDPSSYKCLHFDVVDVAPYQFNFTGIVPIENCHEIAGYKPDGNVKLWNWIDDVFRKMSKSNDKEN